MFNWMIDAECDGQPIEMFFPEQETADTTQEALNLCYKCPVRERCLSSALELDDYGVRGGTLRADRESGIRAREEIPLQDLADLAGLGVPLKKIASHLRGISESTVHEALYARRSLYVDKQTALEIRTVLALTKTTPPAVYDITAGLLGYRAGGEHLSHHPVAEAIYQVDYVDGDLVWDRWMSANHARITDTYIADLIGVTVESLRDIKAAGGDTLRPVARVVLSMTPGTIKEHLEAQKARKH